MAITAYNPTSTDYGYSNTSLNSINQSLTSGSRINSSADDPSGLAIITAMSSQITAENVGAQNALTGISMLQTADGASESITTALQRMSELSLQAQNGTMNPSQRQALDAEFQQNLQEIGRIAESTQFNGQNILNGDVSSVNIQMGDSSNALAMPNLMTDVLGIDGLSLSDAAGASTAYEGLATALETVTTARSEFGAQQNGLQAGAENLMNQSINTQASRSQIGDTNYASAISEQMRERTLQDAQIMMQAQKNQNQGSVLQLLSGGGAI